MAETPYNSRDLKQAALRLAREDKKTCREIGHLLGVHHSTVALWLKDPLLLEVKPRKKCQSQTTLLKNPMLTCRTLLAMIATDLNIKVSH